MKTYAEAVDAFRAARGTGMVPAWADLPFFADGRAARLARTIDARVAAGTRVLPGPDLMLRALTATPRDAVRAVILGQDPYPNAHNAVGLAFAVGRGRPVPASLRTIYDALHLDLGLPRAAHGDLSAWARRGVLLLNATLTVDEGAPNSHARLAPPWSDLTREVVTALSEDTLSQGVRPVVFLAWGAFAQALTAGVDRTRHDVIASRHPSSMGLRGDQRGPRHPFVASQPFARARDAALAHGLDPIDWSLD